MVNGDFKELPSYHQSLIASHKNSIRAHQSCLNMALLKDGVLNAVA